VHAVWLEERARGASALRRFALAASPYHRYVRWMERRVFGSPALSAVICNSMMVKDEIAQRFGVPEAKFHVIYNAVDGEGFSPALRAARAETRARHRIAADALVFLLVGSGYERKGVATALDALARTPERFHLLVVGKEPRIADYVQRARESGVADRATFAGPQVDPRPYFGAADAFVLPTLYDPLPNAALEAMACGLPVVTSTKSGAAELALAADAGFVCASRDAGALAAHMRALDDSGLRERMGANARAAMLRLSPAEMTLKLVLLYRDLLEAGAARRQQRPAPAQQATRHAAGSAVPAGTARGDGAPSPEPARDPPESIETRPDPPGPPRG
jgi:UDP-glucose:(heptosyl)LPS alpha-1,3-glucosyltransferase